MKMDSDSMTKVYAIDGVVPVVHPSSFIHPTAVLIGDVVVGPDCYVAPGASLRGDLGQIVLEKGVSFQDNCIAHGFAGNQCIMREYAGVGHGAVLHGCILERRALAGMNAVIMDGAVIGENAIVAAQAFVRAGLQVPPRHLAAGVPAKILRELTDEEIDWKWTGVEEYLRLIRRSHDTLELVEPLTEANFDGPRIKIEGAKPLYQVRRENRAGSADLVAGVAKSVQD